MRENTTGKPLFPPLVDIFLYIRKPGAASAAPGGESHTMENMKYRGDAVIIFST